MLIAEAITAQTVQQHSNKVDLALQCLRVALPLVGVLLAVLSWLILNLLFELQHALQVGTRGAPYYKPRDEDVEATLLFAAKRMQEVREKQRCQTHNVYRTILIMLGLVWMNLFALTIIDETRA